MPHNPFRPAASGSFGQRQIYSVSKLNRWVRNLLEGEVGSVWISAEISNFTAASSGHWYFTLKDAKAQIKAAMFRGANTRVKIRPKEGDKVLVRGNLSLYEARGDYQLICEHLELDGSGALQAAFEQLKMKLNGLGLFSNELKRPLPTHIARVGVITSPTGAALHDILTVLKRRSPATQVMVYPAQVQGDAAAEQLMHAIRVANQRNEVDVLIVGRGGGSIEDLWCFNDEALAYAIRESAIPIVSAVGHEVDITIADYVADVRAPTPSAAAELISQDVQHQGVQLGTHQRALRQHMLRILQQAKHAIGVVDQRLNRNHPSTRLQAQAQRLDELNVRLVSTILRRCDVAKHHWQRTSDRLNALAPRRDLVRHQQSLDKQKHRLSAAMQNHIKHSQRALQNQVQLLNSVSPLGTLARGYSITLKDDVVIHSNDAVSVGDTVVTKLHQGEIHSRVTKLS
ncbi:exodeoxyribonuclease VII large subunit [Alteromonas oceanisediminis]|uniref:exodeoxyribonuclease VII large subunit n=1 Tax=Alteromonas oceanisediminis TaxID=2836180 RepID=UPI001BDB392B|nr:exodeoxyribonuclease VII large subunit [Alteromonas oceanisediminis]MBT0585743.1 exodeoxyribonuclease VII large subunit [Alteromonas oceanisediminis]